MIQWKVGGEYISPAVGPIRWVILRKHEHILNVRMWVVNVLDMEGSDVQIKVRKNKNVVFNTGRVNMVSVLSKNS